MPKRKVAFVDFETDGIQARPEYPPRPVGVAIRFPEASKSRYYAWGHPTENDCTVGEAVDALKKVWNSSWDVSFHNAKFDLDVAAEHLGLPMLPWDRVQDTMVLAYLADPHAKKIGLKELAERRLGVPPTERDAVRDWLIGEGIVNRANKKSWGADISKAPGGLVGSYAEGDTDRTKLVFEDLYPEVEEAGMLPAYDRERRLISVLLENERDGVSVDLPKLEADVARYDAALEDTARRIFKILGAEFNLDAGEDIADALDRKYPGIQWPLTEKGSRSTSKDSLAIVLANQPPLLTALFSYHATLTTCVRNFMRPWLVIAQKTGGRIHTQWNSVAQSEGGGTRTGRLSSSPNFQNIPTLKSPNFVKAIELWEKHLKKLGLPELPAVRSYVVADSEKHVLIDRDFSQQELRVLAHFEDGQMMGAFQDNPKLDLHEFAAQVISESTGIQLTRKATKNLAFGLLYGLGLGGLAERLGVPVEEAKKARSAYLDTFPGVKSIQRELDRRGRSGLPLTTWGGRRYYAEDPRYAYRLFNYLIQASSADITKEAILRYNDLKKNGRLLLSVHDQIVVSCPKKAWKEEMLLLKEAMNGIPLGAPLTSDGGVGYRWTELEDCE